MLMTFRHASDSLMTIRQDKRVPTPFWLAGNKLS
jgi:hypothetical protein